MMKHLYRTLLLILLLLPAGVAVAHDIVPGSVQTYLAENPDATAEEIRAFVSTIDHDGSLANLTEPAESTPSFIYTYLELGVEHILIGTDHILFIIAMLLSVVSLRMILHRSLVFTVAHSVTFILAGTTALSVSARVVEPIIALSIAAVAILSLFRKENQPYRELAVIFVLGLFHGLGFAGLLADLKLPEEYFLGALVLFNIGIEFGQIVIIAIAYPLLQVVRKSALWPQIHLTIVTALSVVGFWWAVTRLIW